MMSNIIAMVMSLISISHQSVIQQATQELTVWPEVISFGSGQRVTAHVYMYEPFVAFHIVDVQYARPTPSEAYVGILMWKDDVEPILPMYPILPGDANQDGKIDLVDLIIIARHWEWSPVNWSDGDFNTDRIVDLNDLTLMAQNWDLWYNALDVYVGIGDDDYPHGNASVTVQIYEIVAGGDPVMYYSSTKDFFVLPEPSSLILIFAGLSILASRRRVLPRYPSEAGREL